MPPYILLTGATGFIGGHVARNLRKQGYYVGGLLRDGVTPPVSSRGEICDFWLNSCDLRTTAMSAQLQAVVHVATAYGHDGKLADVVESNLLLPVRLLDFCREMGCAQFINTDTFFSKKTFSYQYLQAYIRSKQELLEWARLACDAEPDFRFSSLRLEHVYGEGDSPCKFVPDLMTRLQARQSEILLTPGDQKRDFIHVSDVSDAYICVLANVSRLPLGIMEYEVGTGNAISLRQFAETAREVVASTSHLCFGALPYRPGEIMTSVADIAPLAALGWKPSIQLRDGLRRTMAAKIVDEL